MGLLAVGQGADGTLSSMIVPRLGAPSPLWHDLEGKQTRPPPRDERLPGVVVYFSAKLLFLLALFGVDIFKLVLRYFFVFTNRR